MFCLFRPPGSISQNFVEINCKVSRIMYTLFPVACCLTEMVRLRFDGRYFFYLERHFLPRVVTMDFRGRSIGI